MGCSSVGAESYFGAVRRDFDIFDPISGLAFRHRRENGVSSVLNLQSIWIKKVNKPIDVRANDEFTILCPIDSSDFGRKRLGCNDHPLSIDIPNPHRFIATSSDKFVPRWRWACGP